MTYDLSQQSLDKTLKEHQANDYYAKHRGQPTLIIGNGPSAKQVSSHIDKIKSNFVTIGMNRSWQLIDSQYHIIMFHYEHLEDLANHKYPVKTLWTFKDYSEMWVREVDDGNVIFVPSVADPHSPLHKYNSAGLISLDMSECSYADMTGMFALEVALWMRCDPILLIGFDLHDGHFCDKDKPEDEWRDIQVDLFELTAKQIEKEASWASIYNCNPESRISGFKKVPFEEVLDWQ